MTIIRPFMIAAGGLYLSLSIAAAAAEGSPPFKQLDQNGDQKIDAQEATNWEPLNASFDEVDVDHDGRVDSEEFAGFERALDSMTKPSGNQ